jgi:transcriptional regulator of acetoin/glycerol metabolism
MKDIPRARLCSKDYIRTVGRVWEKFVTDRPVEGDDVVRDVVIESWRRCRRNGVNPATKSAPLRVKGPDVDRFQLSNAEFYDAVRACVPPIVPYLMGSRTILITSDPHGTLLSVDGDPHLTDRMAADHIVPGAAWHEHTSGTNAVGTALALGRPLHIHAEEHFCEVAKPWSCTAAVIRDPLDQRIVGVVDVTGPPDTVNAQTWPFVISLVGQLQGHLQKRWLAKRARLIELFEAVVKGHAAAAILLDVQGRVVAHTAPADSALHELGLDQAPAKSMLVAVPHGGFDPERLAALAPGIRPEWLSPLSEDGHCVGAILHLPTSSRGHRTNLRRAEVRPLAPEFLPLLRTSPSLEGLLRQAERFAVAKTSLLLEGKTGIGKDVLARAVHAAGPFHAGPFVLINCAALPRDILAKRAVRSRRRRLHGSASRRRQGPVRAGQWRRAVPRRDRRHAGGPAALPAACPGGRHGLAPGRGGAAQDRGAGHRCHQPAARQRRSGRTLPGRPLSSANVAGLTLPPLRERTSDIPLLADHLLRDIADMAPLPQIAPDVMDIFMRYRWPGNVRELRNCLARMALLATDGVLSIEHLPATMQDEELAPDSPAASTMRGAERLMVLAAIRREGGNISRAARSLGIARTTLYRHIRRR